MLVVEGVWGGEWWRTRAAHGPAGRNSSALEKRGEGWAGRGPRCFPDLCRAVERSPCQDHLMTECWSRGTLSFLSGGLRASLVSYAFIQGPRDGRVGEKINMRGSSRCGEGGEGVIIDIIFAPTVRAHKK